MAAGSLLVRKGVSMGVDVSVINLIDRRDSASTEMQEWAFQREVEASLYGNGDSQQTGAVYRLLQRSGVGGRALPLKKACIHQGLVTKDEFDWLYNHMRRARSFTLIPLDALRESLSTFGRHERSEALVAALGMVRPDGWDEEEEEAANETEEEAEGDEEDDGDDGDGASIAPTEVMEEREDDIDSGANSAPPSGPSPQAASEPSTKRRHVDAKGSNDVPPSLVKEFEAFDTFRSMPLNLNRDGVSVTPATRESDKARILRFLTWLNSTFTFKTHPTLTIFAHSKIGVTAQRYIKELVEDHGRKYSYAAKMSASFVIVAKFMAAQRTTSVSTASVSTASVGAPVAQLCALHNQCRQQAAQEDQFDVGGDKPTVWLDWEAVQGVRVAAEDSLCSATTKAERLKLTRDVAVLRMLADQPPDRVGVLRTLKLGGSLKRKPDGSYELDLSDPGAHKTSSTFGATRTSINESITPWLDNYIEAAAITEGCFLFHAPGNKLKVISPSAWTQRVKATFARHGDVALCPKDARSSFITFLRSGDHDDETTKAAAVAMRHSSKMQASDTYDKGSSDKRVCAAMKVAADYSARFSSGAASSSGRL